MSRYPRPLHKKLSWKSSKALPKNVSLTWKVRGGNAGGAGAWSKSLTFKIVSPYAPQGTITTPTPTFKWSKVAGVTKYEVRIYQGSKLLLKKTGLKKLSWKSSKALPMHVGLTWKVRGSKGRHTSAWKSFKFTIVPPATHIAPNAGDAQTAVAGTAVAAPSVLVTDAYNYPVSGVSVTFLVTSGGGSLTGASPTTNASGIATLGSWMLGTIAGANTLTATSAGLTGSPVAFSATGIAGAADATQSTLTPASASITADGSSTQLLTVTAKDANGNSLTSGGASVAITQLSGTGTISPVTDNGDGTYTATVTSPTTVDSGVFVATLGGSQVMSGSASQTQATVNYTAGPAAKLAITTQPVGAASGALLSTQPVVQVQDAQGNVVTTSAASITVTSSGTSTIGGSEAGGLAASSGVATFSNLTLAGTVATNYTLTFASAGLTSATSATLTVTVGAADATQSTLTPASATITADGTSTQLLTVTATDANGNSLSAGGASVTITQLSGTGTISPVTDNGDGTYTATVTSPTTVGSGVFVATLGGSQVMSGSASQTQTTVTYVAGAPTQIAPSAGDAQTAVAGIAVATAPSVIVTDAYNNPVSGVSVTFAVTGGGGSVTGASPTTNASGIATLGSWMLGTIAGANTLTATSGGLTGSPVVFSATGIAGAADATQSTLTPASATITADGTSTQLLTVTATDANGNSLSAGGASVTITQLSGTGTISPVTDNGDGTYTATVTSPTTVDSGVFIATLGGAAVQSGSASQTQATVNYVAGAMAKFALNLAAAQSSGAAFSGVNTLTAEDAFGNTVTTYDALTNNVTLSVAPADGAISGLGSALNNVLNQPLDFTSGVANLTGKLVFVGLTGSHNFTATSQIGAYSGTSGSVTIGVGAANKLAITTQPVGAASGAVLSTQPVVKVQDSAGNVVTTSSASITVTSSGTSTIGGSQAGGLAASSGIASFSNLTLAGTVATNYTLTFASAGLTSATSNNLTVTVGAANKLAITTQPVGAASGALLGTEPVVKVEDSAGNVVTTSSASITVTSSGTSTIGGSQAGGLAASSGIASFSNLTLAGTVATNYTLTFASAGLTSATSNNLTVTVGAASKIAVNAGNAQVAPPGTVVATAPSVLVTDASNNPVSGVSVTFAVGSGGGSATGLTPTTNASGIATVGSWTLGPSAGANTLTATSGGLAGSPLTFTATGLTIGTPYGGGVVGYILQSGDPGYVAGQTHGLIAATVDQSTAIQWALPANQTFASGATGTAIGTGLANTNAIVAQNGAGITYAAGLARAYNGGGYNDWYLPSKDELNKLYLNQGAIGGFGSGYYWSSSEFDAPDAYFQKLGDGSQPEFIKSLTNGVRAVRTF